MPNDKRFSNWLDAGDGRLYERVIGRERPWTGRIFSVDTLDVELSDIAHGLARVARWNGQTKGDYAFSVAQHSVLVFEIVSAMEPQMDDRGRLYALLHDAVY